MYAFLVHLMMTFVWAAATGDFSESNLIVGFLLGFIVVALTQRTLGTSAYSKRTWRAIKFGAYFIWEIMIANVRVAHSVIMPTYTVHPAVVAIPLSARSDVEIMVLANVLSLMPGTLSPDVSSDRTVLYLHSMFVEAPDELRHEIKSGFERRLLELLR